MKATISNLQCLITGTFASIRLGEPTKTVQIQILQNLVISSIYSTKWCWGQQIFLSMSKITTVINAISLNNW